jgi:SET and MYND domain-containing protein
MDIEIKPSKLAGGGRGLFTKKALIAGDIVYSTPRPFIAEVDTARLHDTCAWCFRRPVRSDDAGDEQSTVLPCAGCKRIRYCSRSCQSKAWKREHKYECAAIAPSERPDLPHGARAVVKLLGRLKADPQGKDGLLLDVLRFQPYADEVVLAGMREAKPQRCEDFDMLAYGAWKYAGEPKIEGVDSLGLAKGFFYNVGRLRNDRVLFLFTFSYSSS